MDQITLIIDLEGLHLSSGFLVRELGWCTIKGENDSQHFYSRLRYKDLNYKDRRTLIKFTATCMDYASKPATKKPRYRKEI